MASPRSRQARTSSLPALRDINPSDYFYRSISLIGIICLAAAAIFASVAHTISSNNFINVLNGVQTENAILRSALTKLRSDRDHYKLLSDLRDPSK